MPGMPRIPGKPTKIAYAILGVPQNMKKKRKKPDQIEMDKVLDKQATVRVRGA